MSKPQLNEFPLPTTTDWALEASKALKDADPFQKLQWMYEPGLPVKPYFDRNTQQVEALNLCLEEITLAGAKGRRWHYLESIETSDPKQANRQALSALDGAEGILWKVTGAPQMPDPAILFEGVKPEYCQNAFEVGEWRDETADFFSQLLLVSNKLSGFLWFDTPDTARCEELLELFRQAPLFKPLCFDAIPEHEKGLPPSSELAWLLSSFIERTDSLTSRGYTAHDIVTKSVFCLGIGRDYFHGIAKIRALKMLISKAASEFGTKKISPSEVTIFARPSLRNYAVTDPYVNIIRSTAETMAGIIGGAHFITVPAFDCLHPISPEGFSKRIGRNISNLMREESHLDKNADPSAGSYFIESLTEQLALAAWGKMQQAEGMGGFTAALRKGLWEQYRQEFVTEEHRRANKRQLSLIGVNSYNDLDLFREFPATAHYRKTVEQAGIKPTGYDFEVLRLTTEDHLKSSGNQRPEIVPLLFGDKARALARNAFVQGFFPPAGIKVSAPVWWAGSSTLLKNGTRAVVLCSSDGDYTEAGPDIVSQLQKDCPQMDIAVAGNPPAKEALRQIGITTFIHLDSELLEVLTRYQKIFGII